MDTLRTIRERGGDATDMVDRVAKIESDLARLAEAGGRSAIPTGRTDDDRGDDDRDDDGDLINELTGMTDA